MTRPDPTLDRLRTAYRELPHEHMRDLPTLLDHARSSYLARKRTRAALTGVIGVVGVAGLITAVTQVSDADRRTPSNAASSTPELATSADGGQAARAEIRAAVAQLYPQLDAVPSLGYYMIEAREDRVVLWGDVELDLTGLNAAAKEATDQTGVQIDVRPLERAPSASAAQQNQLTEAAADIKRIMRAHPQVGYSTLRMQAPFDQLILWRTAQDATVDRSVGQVARDAGITLELRVADYSQVQAQALISDKIERNDEWAPLGFQVRGGAGRPTGVIIHVDGDMEAAQRALRDEPGVLAISTDSEENLPLTLD